MNAIAPIRAEEVAASSAPARHRFTLDDVFKMVEVGIIDPEARIELLDGEIVRMPEEGEPHAWIKNLIGRSLSRSLPLDYMVMIATTLRVTDHHAPNPGVYVLRGVEPLQPRKAEHVMLMIEIADNSLALDLGRKAVRYAESGVTDYWVVDVRAARTYVLREPESQSYRTVAEVSFGEPLQALNIPGYCLTISELPGMRDFSL